MGSSSESNVSFDSEELSQIQKRCIQLRKEKVLLKESQSQSFELIRKLEQHVKKLSEARAEDKEEIMKLERELNNCTQEIDYLQDQLNAKNADVKYLSDQVEGLELKLVDMENLKYAVEKLGEEMKRSNSDNLYLMHQLENKEVELENSKVLIDQLEEKISFLKLEYQCELESMKLDLMSFEQILFEAENFEGEASQEVKIDRTIKQFESQIKEARDVIRCFDKENKELREKLNTSEKNARLFSQKFEHEFPEWLKNKDAQSSSSESENYTSIYGETLGTLLWKIVNGRGADEDQNGKTKKMSTQTDEHEIIVRQLKEELRAEKLKAKEDTEDLVQEMAELRYQATELLEEERKRRACFEQISLQRIAELEAQIEKEQGESFGKSKHIREE